MSLPATTDTLSVVALAQTIGQQNAQDFSTALVELARRYPAIDPSLMALLAAATPAPVAGAPGVAPPTDATQVGGTDGAIFRAMLVDALGRVLTVGRTPLGLISKQFSAVAVGAAGAVWTPAAGKKVRLLGYSVYAAVAARFDLFDGNASGAFFTGSVGVVGTPSTVYLGPDGVLSAIANNVISWTTGGTLTGTLWGAEE